MNPIGIFHSIAKERYQAARQPGLNEKACGTIRLFKESNFERALDDLAGFGRIWIIFHFHLNSHWRPKVLPPRGGKRRGLFATRSPHRPNPIGLSSVELIEIEGLDILIGSHDLLDGTPILDIKPYIPSIDSFPDARAGWIDELPPEKRYFLEWSPSAKERAAFILGQNGPDLEGLTDCRLRLTPEPHPGRRIKKLSDNLFELGIKAWRLRFHLDLEAGIVSVVDVLSGYTADELLKSEDPWQDKALHRFFLRRFSG